MHPKRIASLIATALCVFVATCLGAGPVSAVGAGPDAAVWPLTPRPSVVAGFDPPAQDWDSGHRGVDLAGSPGQAVGAAKAGQITYAGMLAGRGIVVISHGETRTTYQPVDASVRVGDHVLAGQKVGVLRTPGSHCYPRTCLHWGLIRGETYLDPLTLVGAGPVRLWPLYTDLAALGLRAAGLAWFGLSTHGLASFGPGSSDLELPDLGSSDLGWSDLQHNRGGIVLPP